MVRLVKSLLFIGGFALVAAIVAVVAPKQIRDLADAWHDLFDN